jgi:hypothetical protein
MVIAPAHQCEPSLVNDSLDSRVSCRHDWLEQRVDQCDDRLALPRRRYGDERFLSPTRLYGDKHTIGHQVLPGLLEGMDHALGCDSSKRPAEDRDVEGGASDAQSFRRADAE